MKEKPGSRLNHVRRGPQRDAMGDIVRTFDGYGQFARLNVLRELEPAYSKRTLHRALQSLENAGLVRVVADRQERVSVAGKVFEIVDHRD